MQFDELASHQLHGTFTNKFLKIETLQRRNPLKYMRNPNKVQGLAMGAYQYTYQDRKVERDGSTANVRLCQKLS